MWVLIDHLKQYFTVVPGDGCIAGFKEKKGTNRWYIIH